MGARAKVKPAALLALCVPFTLLLFCAGCSGPSPSALADAAAMPFVTKNIYADNGELVRSYRLSPETGRVYAVTLVVSDSPDSRSAAISPDMAAAAIAEIDGIALGSVDEDASVDVFMERTHGENGSLKTELEYGGFKNTLREYDEAGNLISETQTDGDSGDVEVTTTYSYDDVGNMLAMDRTRWRYNGSTSTRHEEHFYDDKGNETGFIATDGDGAVIERQERTYDGAGNIVTETLCGAEGETLLTMEYEYGPNGLLVRKIETDYNAGASGSYPYTQVFEYAYDESGRVTDELLSEPDAGGGGSKSHYDYDEQGRQIRYVWSVGDEVQILTTYSYDEQGRVAEMGSDVDVHDEKWIAVRPY